LNDIDSAFALEPVPVIAAIDVFLFKRHSLEVPVVFLEVIEQTACVVPSVNPMLVLPLEAAAPSVIALPANTINALGVPNPAIVMSNVAPTPILPGSTRTVSNFTSATIQSPE